MIADDAFDDPADDGHVLLRVDALTAYQRADVLVELLEHGRVEPMVRLRAGPGLCRRHRVPDPEMPGPRGVGPVRTLGQGGG